jgi:hypothetical protein
MEETMAEHDKKGGWTISSAPPAKAQRTQTTQLFAAVSIIAVSLGMSAAYAGDCASGEHCNNAANSATGPNKGATAESIKIHTDSVELKTNSMVGQYTRKKLPGRMKSGTLTITRQGSTQVKQGSTSTKTDTTPGSGGGNGN